MKQLFLGAAALSVGMALAATELTVSARQNWPWDAKVVIDLEMPAGTNDLALVATFDAQGQHHQIELGRGNGLRDYTFCLEGGAHRLIWDPALAGLTGPITDLLITAKSFTPEERAWLVIDTVTGEAEYVPLNEAPTDAQGRRWQDPIYMYQKMVFRRIPAGRATVGYTAEQRSYLSGLSTATPTLMADREVEFTSDYYIGIYQVSQGQAYRILKASSTNTSTSGYHGTKGTATADPIGAGFVCFQRGSNAVEGISWPTTKYKVAPGSHIGRFRERCKNRFMIDLPTAAQWQRAARPDPQWIWYETPYGGGKVGDSCETLTNILESIAWSVTDYLKVGKKTYNPPSVPGKYLPNAFGLCDLVMSRVELTLDYWYSGNTMAAEVVDPVGPVRPYGNEARVCCNSFEASLALNTFALGLTSTKKGDDVCNADNEACYRYVINLKPPQSFGGQWE